MLSSPTQEAAGFPDVAENAAVPEAFKTSGPVACSIGSACATPATVSAITIAVMATNAFFISHSPSIDLRTDRRPEPLVFTRAGSTSSLLVLPPPFALGPFRVLRRYECVIPEIDRTRPGPPLQLPL